MKIIKTNNIRLYGNYASSSILNNSFSQEFHGYIHKKASVPISVTIGDSVTDVMLCQWRSPYSFPATTPVSLLAVMIDACETRQTGQLEIRAGRLWGEMELWDTSPIISDTTCIFCVKLELQVVQCCQQNSSTWCFLALFNLRPAGGVFEHPPPPAVFRG